MSNYVIKKSFLMYNTVVCDFTPDERLLSIVGFKNIAVQ